jgi:hypothetical protein
VSSAKPALQVQGAATLRRTLKAAGVGVQDLKVAHAEVAALVVRVAHPTAPRLTGALDRSTRSSGTQSAAIVRAGSARLVYGPPIHWGWPGRNIKAQPWIQDAAERSEPTWAGLYLHALDAIINTIEGAPGP